MQDVFSQMFLRLVRMRYRRRLMQVVPSPPYYTWWCASSLLASGRPVWKCPDRVFSLPSSRSAAINTLQVIANNKSYTSCHFSCFSKDNMVVMKTIPINFANSPNVEVTTRFTAQPRWHHFAKLEAVNFPRVSSIQWDQRPESPCSGRQRPFIQAMWTCSHSHQTAIAQLFQMSLFNEKLCLKASIKVNQVQIF